MSYSATQSLCIADHSSGDDEITPDECTADETGSVRSPVEDMIAAHSIDGEVLSNTRTAGGGLVLPWWLRCHPSRNRIIWKAHRLLLKKNRFWWPMRIEGIQSWRARYFTEGEFHYLFGLQGRGELLKVDRRQFYCPDVPVNADTMQLNVAIMNQLAREGLSVPARHIWGGCAIVERAGPPLTRLREFPASIVAETFDRIYHWSLRTGWVLTDLTDKNFCAHEGRAVLVDVEKRRLCALSEIARDPFMRRCLIRECHQPDAMTPLAILRWFINRERDAIVARFVR